MSVCFSRFPRSPNVISSQHFESRATLNQLNMTKPDIRNCPFSCILAGCFMCVSFYISLCSCVCSRYLHPPNIKATWNNQYLFFTCSLKPIRKKMSVCHLSIIVNNFVVWFRKLLTVFSCKLSSCHVQNQKNNSRHFDSQNKHRDNEWRKAPVFR